MFRSRQEYFLISVFMMISCICLVFLPLGINGVRTAFAAAVPLPLLQMEEKLPAKAVNQTTGPVNVQGIIGAGGGGVCESCQFIVYKPGTTAAQPRPNIAYVSTTPIDLSGAKRIVFFAKGELGGETVNALALGKLPNSNASTSALRFAVKSPDIVLTNIWKRYELNVDGLDKTGVSAPFGLAIANQKGNAPTSPGQPSDKPPPINSNVNDISFYVKGVSADTTPAANPLNKS
jgi:hypothetical protein